MKVILGNVDIHVISSALIKRPNETKLWQMLLSAARRNYCNFSTHITVELTLKLNFP